MCTAGCISVLAIIFREVAEAIVKHNRWKEGLKIFPSGNTPFRKLITKMPGKHFVVVYVNKLCLNLSSNSSESFVVADTAIKVLDKCVDQPDTTTFEFDFEFIGEFSYNPSDTTDAKPSEANIKDRLKYVLCVNMQSMPCPLYTP